jgi:hypothetical protein
MKKAGSGTGSVNQVRDSKDPDPDPYQNVTDPEHCYPYAYYYATRLLKHEIKKPLKQLFCLSTNP